MILFLAGNQQIRGDLIISAVLRHDLSPIPVTLEAEIRAGEEDMERRLAEGQLVTTGAGDALRIVKSVKLFSPAAQGERQMAAIRVTAMLDACHGVAFVRSRAIIKEGAALSAIYRAAGATLKAVDADFPAPRFYCPVGETPTFHIARVLQEEGGVVRWKSARLQFVRLPDLFKQKPVIHLPNNTSDDVDSGFLERHEVPWFFSLDDAAGFVFGNREKPRSVRYTPFKNAQRLRNMTRCLVHRKTSKIDFSGQIVAGDLVNFVGGEPLCIITAAHVFEGAADSGGGGRAYTRLWLGGLEG